MARNSDSALTNAQIEAKLARYDAYPTAHQIAGGAERGLAWLMTICGVIGLWASLSLIIAEKQKLANPQAVLLCDVNPLVGCGEWIGAWQNEVFFGISNSVLGLAFFAGITALGLVLLAQGQFSRWLWQLLCAGLTGGMIWVIWFMYESLAVEGKLCPYCMVTWVVTIALFVHVTARTSQAGHLGQASADLGRAYARNRWLITGLAYVSVTGLIAVTFWNQLSVLFS
ncbi:vitamin K epoxide reductase family protein [Arcanobacterium pinnipediorum]|uniref:Vitamin K epoxide reductase family protein n=1 Tax=Arcanobacterium pinnipediorum TaxID=1503041 RepID=A0ABY5AFW2_9ACTO|nr:vitamin K epoxide reductase family protein [Arcanobacterium pinnipediorum]USR78762.1 vitamin K epoxide reductase family protein [Arcanobacterium pinnipediorum]